MLSHKGVYSDDPSNLGREIYKGIARASHSNWSGWLIIDKFKGNPGFPEIIDKDVALQQEVDHFYSTIFWFPLNCDRIQNQSIADSIFNFSVNAGTQTSIRMVQSIVETEPLGIQTLNKRNAFGPNSFLPAFTIARIEHYVSFDQETPPQP